MPVPSTLSDLSTTAASNSPAGSDSIGTSLDDYLRSIQAIIKQGVAKGADITAASTITCSADAHYFVVTGNTTITGITDAWNGRIVVLKFSGTPQLTHGSGFVLPGSANITAAAGDVGAWVNESTGVWRCVFFQRADGASIGVTDNSVTTAKIASSAVTTAKIADSNVTYAKIQNVSDASRLLGRGSAGGAGATEEITLGTGLSMSGTTLSATVTAGPTLGTPVASTSGTSIDFTSIPATAKRITITFTGVSTNGSNPLLVQIGDSGGVETTGYTGRTDVPSAGTTSTAGIPIFRNSAANTTHGAIVLYLANSSANTWAASGVTILSDVPACVTSAGTKSLSATLDRVRITSVGGTDTFDAGEINIQYD